MDFMDRGLMLKAASETSSTWKKFASSEYTSTSYRPYIQITYNDSPPACPQVVSGATYYINSYSGDYLDVSNGGTTDNTRLWQYPFNGTPAQQFRITNVSGGEYEIAPQHTTDKVLSVNASNQVIIETDCNLSRQRWYIFYRNGSYHFVNKQNNTKVMEALYSDDYVYTSNNYDYCDWELELYYDHFITDQATKDAIIGYRDMCCQTEEKYNSGEISYSQKTQVQASLKNAADVTRADYVVLNPQSNFVYQYFKKRNYQTGDISPFNISSYTYNASNPIVGLDVIIIQRALELLTYFEPTDEYVYGTYDDQTHEAVLSSPYYILGSNDFQQYSYYDMLGSTTASQRTSAAIQLLRQLRFVHNSVASWTALKVGGRTTSTTIYGAGLVGPCGYADVMKTGTASEYIWEVKPMKDRYLNGTIGVAQLSRYIYAWNNTSQLYTPWKPAIQGYSVGKFAFNFGSKVVIVQSNPAPPADIRSGLIHYDIVTPSQYQQEYETEYVLETQPVPVPVPSYSYSFGSNWSFGDVEISGVAQVGAVVVFIVVIAGVIYFCPPAAALAFA